VQRHSSVSDTASPICETELRVANVDSVVGKSHPTGNEIDRPNVLIDSPVLSIDSPIFGIDCPNS
jgi:hypothetical protein